MTAKKLIPTKFKVMVKVEKPSAMDEIESITENCDGIMVARGDLGVEMPTEKVPIVQLAPGQKIKVECYARLGRGTEHAKWNASNISMLTDTDKDDEKILTVESTGALNPEQIVLEGVQEVSRRVVEFKDMINNIEE